MRRGLGLTEGATTTTTTTTQAQRVPKRRAQARYRRSGGVFSVQDRDLVNALENIKNTRATAAYGNANAFSSATASAVRADVPTALGVYVKGLADTVGFKDSLQNEPSAVEVPVPEHPKELTLEHVYEAFSVETIPSRGVARRARARTPNSWKSTRWRKTFASSIWPP